MLSVFSTSKLEPADINVSRRALIKQRKEQRKEMEDNLATLDGLLTHLLPQSGPAHLCDARRAAFSDDEALLLVASARSLLVWRTAELRVPDQAGRARAAGPRCTWGRALDAGPRSSDQSPWGAARLSSAVVIPPTPPLSLTSSRRARPP